MGKVGVDSSDQEQKRDNIIGQVLDLSSCLNGQELTEIIINAAQSSRLNKFVILKDFNKLA